MNGISDHRNSGLLCFFCPLICEVTVCFSVYYYYLGINVRVTIDQGCSFLLFLPICRLSIIAEKTLAEFLSKATSSVVDGIPLPGMKVRRQTMVYITWPSIVGLDEGKAPRYSLNFLRIS